MPQKIYIVRHGETDYNLERRMQGWLDIPLNAKGLSQAKIAALKLQEITLDFVYSSDLIRAHETAKTITVLNKKEIIVTKSLRERDMGVFSGWKWEVDKDVDKQKLWEDHDKSLKTEDFNWKDHKGESIMEHYSRVGSHLDHIHNVHKDKSVLLVTHGGTINRMLEYYKLKEMRDEFKSITNASVLVLEKNGSKYDLSEI